MEKVSKDGEVNGLEYEVFSRDDLINSDNPKIIEILKKLESKSAVGRIKPCENYDKWTHDEHSSGW